MISLGGIGNKYIYSSIGECFLSELNELMDKYSLERIKLEIDKKYDKNQFGVIPGAVFIMTKESEDDE
jgi:hypothetical protein